MSEKRFKLIKEATLQYPICENEIQLSENQIVDLLNSQSDALLYYDKLVSDLKKENEQLQKETFFLAYWKRKAMILLMQVRRLTPRMTEKEVREFAKELEEDEG